MKAISIAPPTGSALAATVGLGVVGWVVAIDRRQDCVRVSRRLVRIGVDHGCDS